MQRSGRSKVIALLPLLIGMVLQPLRAVSQVPANPKQVKKAASPAINLAERTYVPPPTTQAVLTLTADSPVTAPNQPIKFTLTWNRSVVRVSYHFDWGDQTQGSDTTASTATYQYPAPGIHTVRVTATPALPAERMKALNPSQVPSIQSNAVTINVLEPVQPPTPTLPQLPPTTVALTADKTSVQLGDPVSFTASLNPTSAAAQFHFDFGDGYTLDTASNLAAHNYSVAGRRWATVTAADANGNQQASSSQVEVTVLKPAPPPPVVQLTPLSQGLVVIGQPISVRAVLNPPTRNTGFEFDWGDGTPPQTVSNKGLGTHIYTASGTMEVTATALTEAYLPPLQSSLSVQISPKSWWPPSLGIIAGAGGALIVFAVLGWLIFKPAPPPSRPTQPHIVQQHFRYEASQGSSVHLLQMAPSSSNIGPLKLSSGMGSEEHRIKFPGRADTSK